MFSRFFNKNSDPCQTEQQIRKTDSPNSAFVPAEPDASHCADIGTANARSTAKSHGGADAVRAESSRVPCTALSIAAIEALGPHGHIKAACPHVWERICLFCVEPPHLEKYLASIFIQERGAMRAGFPPEAMLEIAAIQAANQRFVPISTADTGWQEAPLHR